ncbi:dimethylamine monooxygenase subunit DmmA family protein [Actinocorallia longicatena]|uniref:Dimethylamine monooxygenase subunit DmmA family protein n=1 Tax=Actinocorallia longicatena TaxID=111803 RepID=A0ABP6PWD0_9ACTN
MAIDRTSVPRWGPEPPGVDAAGRSFAIVSLGEAALPVAAAWAAEIAPGLPLRHVHAEVLDEALLARFGRELGRAVVGWRLMLAGPEDEVQVLRARAAEAGALPCEVRAHATATGALRVYCAHCRTTGRAAVEIGGVLPCTGCGADLVVHAHHSRRLAAYLGTRAHVETP